MFAAVPSAPLGLQANLIEEYPPVASVSWMEPKVSNGDILAYRITYAARGEAPVEERNLGPNNHHYTTGFLGLFSFRSANLCAFGSFGVEKSYLDVFRSLIFKHFVLISSK